MTIHCPDCGHLTRTDTPPDGYVYEVCTNDECPRVTVSVRAQPAHPSQRIRNTGDAMRETRRAELREEWRERADDLDKYARRMRAAGDTREAEDAEAAAMDYRLEADELGQYEARPADEDMCGGRNTLTRFADADLSTP